MKKAVKIIFLLIMAIAWMVVIFKLSDMNTTNSNGKSSGLIGIFIEDTLDITNEYGITDSHPNDEKIERATQLLNAPMRKVAHASVYFVLAFFVFLVMGIIFDHKYYAFELILTLIIAIMFACTDEFHQTFVSGRTGAVQDVVIDSLGAIVGCLFYSTYYITYRFGYNAGLNREYEDDETDKEA